jgi:uncharacterized lipoprotein YddW (UPF0748 family)
VYGEIKTKTQEGSDSKAGQTNYDDLYADILLWLKEKWVDYVAPQLYLEIGHDKIDYAKCWSGGVKILMAEIYISVWYLSLW